SCSHRRRERTRGVRTEAGGAGGSEFPHRKGPVAPQQDVVRSEDGGRKLEVDVAERDAVDVQLSKQCLRRFLMRKSWALGVEASLPASCQSGCDPAGVGETEANVLERGDDAAEDEMRRREARLIWIPEEVRQVPAGEARVVRLARMDEDECSAFVQHLPERPELRV